MTQQRVAPSRAELERFLADGLDVLRDSQRGSPPEKRIKLTGHESSVRFSSALSAGEQVLIEAHLLARAGALASPFTEKAFLEASHWTRGTARLGLCFLVDVGLLEVAIIGKAKRYALLANVMTRHHVMTDHQRDPDVRSPLMIHHQSDLEVSREDLMTHHHMMTGHQEPATSVAAPGSHPRAKDGHPIDPANPRPTPDASDADAMPPSLGPKPSSSIASASEKPWDGLSVTKRIKDFFEGHGSDEGADRLFLWRLATFLQKEATLDQYQPLLERIERELVDRLDLTPAWLSWLVSPRKKNGRHQLFEFLSEVRSGAPRSASAPETLGAIAQREFVPVAAHRGAP